MPNKHAPFSANSTTTFDERKKRLLHILEITVLYGFQELRPVVHGTHVPRTGVTTTLGFSLYVGYHFATTNLRKLKTTFYLARSAHSYEILLFSDFNMRRIKLHYDYGTFSQLEYNDAFALNARYVEYHFLIYSRAAKECFTIT